MKQPAPPSAEPAPRPPEELRHALERRGIAPLTLTLTQNRRTYLSFRGNRRQGYSVRIHQAFLDAGDGVLDGVAAFIAKPGDGAARSILRDFWRERGAPTMPPEIRERLTHSRTRVQGDVHDLLALLAEVVQREGLPTPLPTIGWGRRSHRRRRRHIRLGSYDFEGGHITISPTLDHRSVPRYVLRQVIFHELLHREFGVSEKGGRRILHPPELRRREAQSPDYDPAEAWIKAHIQELLRR